MRHAHMMGVKEPLMWRLVPILIGEMGKAFPELERAEALISETLKLEETRFRETLGRGIRLLEDATKTLDDGAALPGEVAFKLYDTFGFPLDLTEDALRAKGHTVDRSGFDTAMDRQRAEARRNWAGSGEDETDKMWLQMRDSVGATEFLGYTNDQAEGKVISVISGTNSVESAGVGAEVMVVANQTPFYAESGGQLGDTGTIKDSTGLAIHVTNTLIMASDLHVHLGKILSGTISVKKTIQLQVDTERRAALRRNHSATHLLHAALRNHLGKHVSQKGSLVAPDRLRFDISHPKAIGEDELYAIEQEVNREILANNVVTTNLMPPEDAMDYGALALFGEKYGDEVRVISMVGSTGENYSVELCGGTHVKRTGDIGMFRIISESAIGAGLRRIEAVTGIGALDFSRQQESILRASSNVLKVKPAELAKRIEILQEEYKKLRKDLSEARRRLATGGASSDTAENTKDVGGIKFLARQLTDVPASDLRGLADELKKTIESGVVALATQTGGKAAIVVAVSDDLTERVDAVELVRIGSVALGGKGGGGRPDMAQAGGPNGSATRTALNAVEKALATVINNQAD